MHSVCGWVSVLRCVDILVSFSIKGFIKGEMEYCYFQTMLGCLSRNEHNTFLNTF